MRSIRAVPTPHARLIEQKVSTLTEQPRPSWAPQLVGHRSRRFRVGTWRVLFDVDDAARTVTVLYVGRRDEVYRGL
ncbi:MAG: type II toxin-antitoxin system RelE family toxin [Acidithiobacillales bacterium]